MADIYPDESYLQFVARKLITKEDHLHLHKALGILVLTSYAWRFSMMGDDDMGFRKYPQWTLPTVFLHLCLNVSSFEFFLPKQRIKDGGRIWPEYRMHAIIFLTRSLLAVLWRCYYETSSHYDDPTGKYFYVVNWCLIMINLAAADWATRSVGEYASRSIRDAKVPVFWKYWASTLQFGGTVFIMGSRRMTLPFYYAFVVQINPFMMTLVRKNIISHGTNCFLYGFELAAAFYISYYEGFHYETPHVGLSILYVTAALALFWRMGPWPAWVPRNKYLIWTTMYLLMQFYFRPIKDALPVVRDFEKLTPTVHAIRLFGDFFMYGVVIPFFCYKQIRAAKLLWFDKDDKTTSEPMSTNGVSVATNGAAKKRD